MSTATPMYEWETLPWRQLERAVFKLQKRIFQASRRGDARAVHRLQRLLINSWAAKCIAVRRVTQDNQGKKTAGVDGVKSLSPRARIKLVKCLLLTGTSQPTRRVWIPKPGTEEERPLGIPTMDDRARQALVKLALEPEWEAKFEANSYGFRPGRSAHDAIEAIFNQIRFKAKFVLDADIAKCFDRIGHQALLNKLRAPPTIRRQVKAWLRAGVMDGDHLFPTLEGTPQGGVVSPLLANIALDGLEELVKQALPKSQRKQVGVIRYADDFVILHESLEFVQRAQAIISEWLAGMGLELKPSKTRISHTLEVHQGNVGFDFLGFHIRQYEVAKSRSAHNSVGQRLGFKTIIKPSDKSVRRHVERLREIVQTHKGGTKQEALIHALNPVIRGWCNYFSTVCSKEVFNGIDNIMYGMLRRWALRRHHCRGKREVARKYWLHRGEWKFSTPLGVKLFYHDQTPIRRHTKVQESRSPFDGDWIYWSSRLGKHPETPSQVAKLLKRQKGRCPWCGLFFKDGDLLEADHIDSNRSNNKLANLQLLHRHCHDAKTARDYRSGVQGMRDKH
jgi:RNA-directed DNA polymerase